MLSPQLPQVIEDMKDKLNSPFTREEVIFGVNQIKGNDAPGPDGMSARFYQTYWEIVGEEVTQNILKVLNNQDSPLKI